MNTDQLTWVANYLRREAERLYRLAEIGGGNLLRQAADKIESLEREVAELRSHGQGVNENPTGAHPVYRHIRTGRLYERVADATDEWTLDDVVCYRSVEDGEYWVRDAREFNDPKRFERIEGER